MSEKEIIQPKDFKSLSKAFAAIAGLKQPKYIEAADIIRDEQTGQIDFVGEDADEILVPLQVLERLKAMPDFIAETRQATAENIKLVARLGASALEALSTGDRHFSQTTLAGIQRSLANIGQKTALAYTISDNREKTVAQAIGYINSTVNPNPRLKNVRRYHELFEQ